MAGVDGTTSFLVRTNLLGAYHCLEEAARHRAQVLFLSTSRVYPVRALNALAYEEGEMRFELLEEQPLPGASARGVSERFPLEGARTLYGASKLAAELLITEYAESFGLPTVVDRCGVVAGPWQMGKVDQGVFTHWMLAFYYRRPLSYLGFGGQGKQVRDLLHVADLAELVDDQLQRPEHWDGAVVNVGGGAAVSLSLRETSRLCHEIVGHDLEIVHDPNTRGGRRAHLHFRLRCTAPLQRLASPPHAGGDPRRHLHLGSRPRARRERGARRLLMAIAIITGSGGLIGSESVRFFAEQGFDVIGVENDMRAHFFGPEASTAATSNRLAAEVENFRWEQMDIRDREGIDALFARHGSAIELIVHTAAQPSHDWAASDPHTDFSVNANGTLNLLQSAREHAPAATFIFMSTNKVYGDRPNYLPLQELETRLELPQDHRWYGGIDTEMSIDLTTHSLFGVSKVAADLLVQEYGRYFDMPTVCFRGGCLTGPQHAGAQLHGFLAYLMKCTVTGTPYTIFGYGGKQVRDNIHAHDVVRAFAAFHERPRPAAVYNLGGGRESNISMIEAIELCEQIAGRELDYALSEQARIGDHRWWISDLDAFKADYPAWQLTFGIEDVMRDIYEHNVEQWAVTSH